MELTIDQALQQGIAAHREGKLQDAERLYRAILQVQPNHPDANHNLGVLAVSVGKPLEALPLFQLALEANSQKEQFWLSHLNTLIKTDKLNVARRVLADAQEAGVAVRKLRIFEEQLGFELLALNPRLAVISSNLGAMAAEAEDWKSALTYFERAVEIDPSFAEAHNNLGNTLKELERLNEAEASYRQAIALKPDYAKAHNNLGLTLQELGRLDESISSYVRAINLKADFDIAYSNLGLALKGARFNKTDPSLHLILINLLYRGNFVRPKDVAGAILSLLRLENLIEDELLNTTAFTDIKEVDRAINSLTRVPLLHQLMRVCPLPDLQLEALFVSMRRVLLTGLGQIEASAEVIYFLSTLSLHCFTNEYVYFETGEEAELIIVLEAAIAESIAQASQPTVTETLVLATYRPLHQYDWSDKLQVLNQLPEVKARLLEEPLVERVIAQNMPALSDVDDDVSKKVREQYEESPYPRWVKLAIYPKAQSVSEVCNEAKLQLHSENIKSAFSPSILIAGCGTGQHSIETACRFANCTVTAVDLSRASLAYAQRKTNELGITNIEYLQADILNLDELGQEFDIIESAGVLHHMDDPMAGWRVLVDLLKTGGLMRIGLYSELARHHIVRVRGEIASLRVGISESDIREFRQSLVKSQDEQHQLLTVSSDFFSLSTLRDLIFHVQEHRFTLPQISKSLDELGLVFCGFENTNIVKKFNSFFGAEADAGDLSLWHQFEEQNPRTFKGMYQFWCQKI